MKGGNGTGAADNVALCLKGCNLAVDALKDRQIHRIMQHKGCDLSVGRSQGFQVNAHISAIALSASDA